MAIWDQYRVSSTTSPPDILISVIQICVMLSVLLPDCLMFILPLSEWSQTQVHEWLSVITLESQFPLTQIPPLVIVVDLKVKDFGDCYFVIQTLAWVKEGDPNSNILVRVCWVQRLLQLWSVWLSLLNENTWSWLLVLDWAAIAARLDPGGSLVETFI